MKPRRAFILLALVVAATAVFVLKRPGQYDAAARGDFARSGSDIAAPRHETNTPPGAPVSVVKETLGADGKLHHTAVYRLSPKGSPLVSDVFNADGIRVLKNRFGYHASGPSKGKLAEIQVFDAETKRQDTRSEREIPIRRVLYRYDSQGNRAAPVTVETVPDVSLAGYFDPAEFDSLFPRETHPVGGR